MVRSRNRPNRLFLLLSPRYWLGQRDRLLNWLETHWINPAYSGWVLMGLCLFFFAAASNTMAGWLYVMSGVGFALLAVAAWLARRGLTGLKVMRVSSPPVAVGQEVRLEVIVNNGDRRAKSLLQLIDPLPKALGGDQTHPIPLIGPHSSHTWRYQKTATQRGLYRWGQVQARTAAPLGLCWYSKMLPVKAKAVVYPTILQLSSCPLVDGLGQQQNPSLTPSALPQAATEGLTRSLRPYRWGDPIRRVHWRTSARFGELRVRELEDVQTGQEVVLAIDSASLWQSLGLEASASETAKRSDRLADSVDSFEQAMTALASLYRYASRHYGAVQIWTASHGLINGEQRVLEALAGVKPGEAVDGVSRPPMPLIWLTQDAGSLQDLPPNSAWLLWPGQERQPAPATNLQGKVIDPSLPLPGQLQSGL